MTLCFDLLEHEGADDEEEVKDMETKEGHNDEHEETKDDEDENNEQDKAA